MNSTSNNNYNQNDYSKLTESQYLSLKAPLERYEAFTQMLNARINNPEVDLLTIASTEESEDEDFLNLKMVTTILQVKVISRPLTTLKIER